MTHPLSRRTLVAGGVAAVATRHPMTSFGQTAPSIAWERLVTEGTGPAPRWDHVLLADAERGRLILFGGRDAAGAVFGDTWVFDLEAASWTELPGSQPDPRFGAAAAADAAGGSAWLFGGQAGDTFFNDTWRYDLATAVWEPVNPGDGVAPTPRYGLGGVIDDASWFIVSHGFTFDGRFDDTWAFDLAVGGWSDISPPAGARPLKRCLHEQVWAAASGVMLLYAGCSSGFGPCPQGDTWTFDPALGAWTEVTPATSPEARSNPALTRSPDGAATLLVGGLTAAGYAADAWLGTLTEGTFAWTPVEPGGDAPSPRASHDLATLGDRVYLFGGNADSGPLGDLWSATLA